MFDKEILQIWIEYTKPIGQMSDEPWKFFWLHWAPQYFNETQKVLPKEFRFLAG